MKKKSFLRAVSSVLTLAIILTSVTTAFASSLISENTREKSIEIANQIESEGIVLLKNEDNALPLKTKKVNVFGAASCSIAFAGAAGSGAVRSSDAVGFYDALTNAGIEYNQSLYNIYSKATGTNVNLGIISYVITVLKQFFGGGPVAFAEFYRHQRAVAGPDENPERPHQHHHRKIQGDARHRRFAAAAADVETVHNRVQRIEAHRHQRRPRIFHDQARYPSAGKFVHPV